MASDVQNYLSTPHRLALLPTVGFWGGGDAMEGKEIGKKVGVGAERSETEVRRK